VRARAALRSILRLMLRLVSLCGIAVLLALCFAFSRDRRAISWRLVGTGLLLQAVLGLTFLYWSAGNAALQSVGRGVNSVIDLGQAGAKMVFGSLATSSAGTGFVFAFQILPTLIFFSSLMAVLYHLGVMQVVVRGMAVVTARLLGTSGSESLSACGNVFVGQTEAPLLVRPFLRGMTMSELHTVMVGGFATIAGGVFAAYVGFVGGEDPVARAEIAGRLMVASVMAVPAGLICSKLLWPETETSQTMGKVTKIESAKLGNVVEAAASGAGDGLSLALNVGAMLIAFLGLLALVNAGLGLVHPDLSLQLVLGYAFWPIASVMGVPFADIPELAQLIGTKLIATEFVAYQDLGKMAAAHTVSPRTVMIASFALCGFANFSSVAIQIGGLGAMAPERRGDLARLGLRAMFGGAIATCMTACVAGVLASEGGS
jgi:concentrative nucleoside transporter, CNT family